jgi:hypothetical protein
MTTVAVAEWEARAELSVGVLITRYLAENPCPGPSLVCADFGEWSELLQLDGRLRLEETGSRAFRIAVDPATRGWAPS